MFKLIRRYDRNKDLVPPFAAITTSTLLGRLSTRLLSVSVETFAHSSRRVFVRLQSSQVLQHQTHPTMSLWSLLCALGHSHAEIEKCLPQTVCTKMEA